MSTNENNDPREKIELTNPENLARIKDKDGKIIDYEKANGRELFNHYRQNMTLTFLVLKYQNGY